MLPVAHLIVVFIFSGLFSVAYAQTPLESYFNGLKTLTADFEQSVNNPTLKAVQTARGHLAVSRPGKFLWDYQAPYQQKIVSDGKKIWIYDTDLEQVTIKRLDEAVGNTPALLLSSEKPVSETFSVKELPGTDGVVWVILKPKDSEAGFTEVKLGFQNNQIVAMNLVDNLGQTTQLKFRNAVRNGTVNSQMFEFQIPKGADVFDTTKE